jgi:hypothetical protein
MKDDDGGPAYPGLVKDGKTGLVHNLPGMSLRDYFAGQVLASIMAQTIIDMSMMGTLCNKASLLSYRIADAMLLERQK